MPGSRTRIGLGLLAICGLLAVWVVRDRRRAEPVTAAPAAKPTPNPLLRTDLLALPELVRSRYRVAPDHRFRIALAALDELATGRAPRAVETRFRDGGWDVILGGEEVGRLPEVPGFADDMALLVAWIKAHPSPASAAAAPSTAGDELTAATAALDPQAILGGLVRLNGAFARSPRDPGTVAAASGGFAWLSLLGVDHLEQMDAVHGRAWAVLALERALELPSAVEHETVLAGALGYETAAAAAAQGLPAGDPLRLYAERRPGELVAACSGRPRDLVCHYLALSLIAERGGENAFDRALQASPFAADERPPVPVLGLICKQGWGRGRGGELAWVTLAALARARGDDELPVLGAERSSRKFENDLQTLTLRSAGRLADRATVQSYYRGGFYTGLFEQASEAVDQYGSAPAGHELVEAMKDPAPGVATQLRRWTDLRAAAIDNGVEVADLQAGIRELDLLGASAVEDLVSILDRLTSPTDFPRREPVPSFFARLDARPLHLAIAGSLASRMLWSPYLYEKYLRAAAAAAPHADLSYPTVVALFDEDKARLRAILADPGMSQYARGLALEALEELGEDESYLRARYAEITSADRSQASPLFHYLLRIGDRAGALAAVRDALAHYPDGEDIGWAHLKTEEAALLRELGRLDEAMAVITPAVDIFSADVVEEAAAIELERGHLQAGIKLARAALARYPDSSRASALIARGQWLGGEFAAAARELAASRNRVTDMWNAHLPAAFAAAFAKTPERDAADAWKQLVEAKLPPDALAQIAGEWGRKGHVDAALHLLEGLRTPRPESKLHTVLVAYDLLREAKGDDAALAWVTKTVAVPTHQEAIILLEFRRCALLLGRYPPPQADEHRQVRVMLAAALLQLGETQGSRWESLVQAVERDAHPRDWYRNVALVLLGKAELSSLRPLMEGMDAVEDVGWVQGMRAAHEGRAEEADAWFQVSLEGNHANNPPPAWAYSIETDWLQSHRSLASLARRGALLLAPRKPKGALLGS